MKTLEFSLGRLGALAALLTFASSAGAMPDPFTPYLESVATLKESLGETASGAGNEAITTRRFTLSSKGGVNTVFAIRAEPQAAGQYPAVLVLHGGGSRAEDVAGLAESFARSGYVALAIDQPGICGTNNTPNSSGPWKSRPGSGGEPPRFDIASGPQNSILVDAEVAGLEAFNYLRALPNVRPEAMGITGFSWGGYSTTMLSGLLGSKVAASYAVYGCGFYEKGSFWQQIIADLAPNERELWLKYLDAGRRAPQIEGAHFLEGETNDTFFWPEAVAATIEAAGGDKNHVWGPNLNHEQLPAGRAMQQLHFDYRLKAIGQPFAKASVSSIAVQGDGSKQVSIQVEVPAGVTIAKAQLYYSEQAPTWPERAWSGLDASAQSPASYVATIPPEVAAKQIHFYAFVTDTRQVSVSSMMYDSSSVVVPEPQGGGGVGGAGGSGVSGGGVGQSAGGVAGSGAGAGGLSGDAGSSLPMSEGGGGALAVSPTRAPTSDTGCSCRAPSSGPVTPPFGAAFALAGWLGVRLASVSARQKRAKR